MVPAGLQVKDRYISGASRTLICGQEILETIEVNQRLKIRV